MTAELHIDAEDLQALSGAIGALPESIKVKAFMTAMRRMRDMARTRVVKRNAERVDIPPSRVRRLTTATFNAGGNSMSVVLSSGWIPLYALGATQTSRGVRVRSRGSYRHAFLAEMESGHAGVFRRVPGTRMAKKPNKEAIRELFGPNPAHDVTNNPDVYLEVLAELIEQHLEPRVLHEIDRLLPR